MKTHNRGWKQEPPQLFHQHHPTPVSPLSLGQFLPLQAPGPSSASEVGMVSRARTAGAEIEVTT